MAQSLFLNYLHIVFSTKNRMPWLRDPEERASLHAYLAGICKRQNCPALVVGGYHDHVHLLVRMAKDKTPPVLIQEIKETSSKWIKKKGPGFADFYWQAGYGCFGVSATHIADVRAYIANQEEHHKGIDFKDEFRRILQRNRVSFDERFLWD